MQAVRFLRNVVKAEERSASGLLSLSRGNSQCFVHLFEGRRSLLDVLLSEALGELARVVIIAA